MTLSLYSFALPVVIGYILFVGIAGKLSPFNRPFEDGRKPAWFLGIWTGLSVALTLALALNIAFRLTATSLEGLAIPTLALLILMLAPGFVAWYWYKQKISRRLTANFDLSDVTILTQETEDGIYYYDENSDAPEITHWNTDWDTNRDTNWGVQDLPTESHEFEISDESFRSSSEDSSPEVNGETESETYFTRDQINPSTIENSMKLTDVDQYNRSFWRSRKGVLSAIGGQLAGTVDNSATITQHSPDYDRSFDAARLRVVNTQHQETQLTLDLNDGNSAISGFTEAPHETQAIEVDNIEVDNIEVNNTEVDNIEAEDKVLTLTLKKQLTEANKKTVVESEKRVQAETHLRITRKALSNLELKTRTADSQTTDLQIELEDKLTENIRSVAVADAKAEREKERRISIENELLKARQETLQAKKETRKNIAARAKILKTANKAIFFARQSVDARANVENEITALKDKLSSQHDTITSLISSLEEEQKNSLEVKTYLTKQILKQKKNSKTSSVRSDSAQSGTLRSRLVKKVARSASPEI